MARRLERHTATLDADVLAEIRREVGPRGVSAFLNEAARQRLQSLRIKHLLREMDEEVGPVPPEIMDEVKAELDEAFGL